MADLFKNSKQLLGQTIKQNRAWYLYLAQSKDQENITFQQFNLVTTKLIPDLSPEQRESFKENLFLDQYVPLTTIASALNISVLDQGKAWQYLNKSPQQQQEEYEQQAQEKAQQQQSQTNRPSQENQKQKKTIIEKQTQRKLEEDPQNESKEESKDQKEQSKKPQKSLEDEIYELFHQVDLNNNGWLDQRELHDALISVGINPSPAELVKYFKSFDKNSDEKISREEFEIVLKDILMQEMLHADDLIETVRNEFRIICHPNFKDLDPLQVKQVFKKFEIELENRDLNIIFNEMDSDNSGFIDIDELVFFLQKPFHELSKPSQEILMRVKGAKKDLSVRVESIICITTNAFLYFIYGKKQQTIEKSTFKCIQAKTGLKRNALLRFTSSKGLEVQSVVTTS